MVRKESADPKLTVSCGPHCRNTIMKLTKNAAALLLAASLAVSVCATPVFGLTNTASASGVDVTDADKTTQAKTDVEYVVEASYSWSVPSKITFTSDKTEVEANAETGETQKVKVTKNVIPNGKKLQITVDSETTQTVASGKKFAIKTNEDAYLTYVIKKGTDYNDEIAVGGEVISVNSGIEQADTALKFVLTRDSGANVSEKAGTYTGVAKFTAQLADITTGG